MLAGWDNSIARNCRPAFARQWITITCDFWLRAAHARYVNPFCSNGRLSLNMGMQGRYWPHFRR